MTTEIACAGYVDKITTLLKKCDFLSGTRILLEQQPQHLTIDMVARQNMLCFADYPLTGLDITSYTSGRIFQDNFELRWEKDAGKVHVVYLGEKRKVPMLEVEKINPAECILQRRHYYLFGKKLDKEKVDRIGEPAQEGDFAEVRIPRLLRYPVKTNLPYVQLVVLEYLHADTGELMMFRFQNLLEVKE